MRAKVVNNHMFIKKIALVFLIVIGLLLSFHQTLVQWSLQFYLARAAKNAGFHFTHDHAYAKPNQLTLHHPKLILGEDSGQLVAEALTIGYSFHPLEKTVALEFELTAPQIEMTTYKETLEQIISQVAPSSSWLHVHWHLKCDKGQIKLFEEGGSDAFEFSLDHCSKKNSSICYVIRSSQDPLSNFSLSLNESNGWLQANQFPLKKWNPLIHAFFPHLKEWVLTSGILTGDISFKNEKEATGSLYLLDAEIQHQESKTRFKSRQIDLEAFKDNPQEASLRLTSGALSFADNERYGVVKDLNGTIFFDKDAKVDLALEGMWSSFGEDSQIHLIAKTDINTFNQSLIEINLNHLNADQSPSLIHFAFEKGDGRESSVFFDFVNVRQREFVFAQHVLDYFDPKLVPLRYISGTLDISGKLNFQKKELASIAVDKINARDCYLLVNPWELAIGSDQVIGQFSFDLTDNSPQSTLNALIEIKNGRLALAGLSMNPLNFTHIETKLEIQEGVVQASSASVQLAGLKGKVEIPHNTSKELLHLTLFGKAKDLRPFVPMRIQNGIDASLADDEIALIAQVNWITHGVQVDGMAQVKSAKSMDSPQIPFGFIIDRLKPSKIPFQSEMKNEFLHVIASSNPSFDSGFRIRNGWMRANNLLLEKFVSPFLFPENEFELSGLADVEGEFDEAVLTLRYGGRAWQMKNDRLIIDLPSIAKNGACHTFNFLSQNNYGYLPVNEGSYFDRNTGLLFTDISAKGIFEGDRIHLKEMEAFSNSLYFTGNLDVDYSSEEKGAYIIGIHADRAEGTFSSLKDFFNHFEKPFFFTKLPLEGIVEASGSGIDLLFDVREEDYDFTSKVEGTFSDGKMQCPHELCFQELAFDFSYDQAKNRLEFSDIQGMVLLGSPANIEEFSIHSDHIYFSDFENSQSLFDLSIKDADQEFIRIKGSSHLEDKLSPSTVSFLFDLEKTHIGSIFPSCLKLKITDWNQIDELKIESAFTLKNLVQDVNRFGLANLFSVSKNFLSDFEKNEEIAGDFDLTLGFDSLKGLFEFNLQGSSIHFGDISFKDVNFMGYNRGDRWFIEQFQVDRVSMASEITKIGNEIKVDFLGFKLEEALLLGLEGTYHLDDAVFDGKVNLLEADLSQLKKWEKIEDVVAAFNLNGKIKGSGKLKLSKKELKGVVLETALDLSCKGIQFEDVSLGDVSHCRLHFISDEGFSIQNFKTSIVMKGNSGAFGLDLKEISYDLNAEMLKISDLNFGVDAPLLPWTGATLHKYLPRAINEKLAAMIGEIKKQGIFKGSLNLQTSSLDKSFHLSFEDGSYYLFGENRRLKNLTLDSQEDELKISALYTLNQQPIWISARLDPNILDRGSVLLADAASDEFEHPALVLDWRIDPEDGFVIEKALGVIAGLKLNLKESAEHATDSYQLRLSGEIDIDGERARPLLSETLKNVVDNLQLGKGYRLQGEFEISKHKEENEGLRFFGMLFGRELELKGYIFNQLASHVIIEPSSFQLLNCTLSDPAGTLHMGNLRADKIRENFWKLQVPLLTMHELRPSLLRTKEMPRPIRKPLVVREVYLQNLNGILGDSDSFKADGHLSFINPQKKNLQNVLFAIPSEILTRIGLNLSVLTPVTGQVYFNLKNGYFVLKKFKDVYSEGKISKFYLPSLGAPSTVDLDGNANIQVRFKQSTLLLKLAEMFTITLKGHISNPRYSLQRQKYLNKQEEVYTSEFLQEDSKLHETAIR